MFKFCFTLALYSFPSNLIIKPPKISGLTMFLRFIDLRSEILIFDKIFSSKSLSIGLAVMTTASLISLWLLYNCIKLFAISLTILTLLFCINKSRSFIVRELWSLIKDSIACPDEYALLRSKLETLLRYLKKNSYWGLL